MSGNEMINIQGEYTDYLRDESRLVGYADSISFPQNENDIRDILSIASKSGISITIQGGRTGITAGAVPFGGHILNLDRMNKITGLRFDQSSGNFFLSVQPGVLLSSVNEVLMKLNFDTSEWSGESFASLDKLKKSRQQFFPPDPTETSATIGGMVACNASGARSFYYGPVRRYIEMLHVMLPDGSMLYLKRGAQKINGRLFTLVSDSGKLIKGELPGYHMPDVKNASGYYIKDGMDLIDLFIGSEGTLGIVTGIEIRLLQSPEHICGIMAFFPSDECAIKFVRGIRGEKLENIDISAAVKPISIEYFNHNSLKLLRKLKETNPAFSNIPGISPGFHTAIYVEYHGSNDNIISDALIEASGLLVECGGNEDSTWIAVNPGELERLRFLRHAVPEAVNLLIDQQRRLEPGLSKLGTDMAVPDAKLEKVINLYNNGLENAGLDSVMFGHIGNNHIHVNILPKDMAQYNAGKQVYLEWAHEIIKMGGTVSAEHGIGKLKVGLLREMYGKKGIEQMHAVKKTFDPGNILNKGNLF